MFVITADQINSRADEDRVPEAFALLGDLHRDFAAEADRNAGDEIQVVTASPATALEAVLRLSRTGRWSVGLGIGNVRHPLPRMAREATGAAFLSAREAVAQAKRRSTRFALRAETASDTAAPRELRGDDAMALIDLLIAVRDRRTPEGWEVCDLMATEMKQTAAAEALGVTPQAVSLRLRAAGWRLERQAVPTLALVLDLLDRSIARHEEGDHA